jgi:hypothetical protein
MYPGLLPDVTDPLTAPYWEAAREGRLVVQRCLKCGHLRWLPAELCPECLSDQGEWTPLSGAGTVWSFAVYHRAMHPAFAELVPYTVGLVELDEGPRMVGVLRTSTGDADADGEVHIGDPVSAVFDPVTPEVTLIRWQPTTPGSNA